MNFKVSIWRRPAKFSESTAIAVDWFNKLWAKFSPDAAATDAKTGNRNVNTPRLRRRNTADLRRGELSGSLASREKIKNPARFLRHSLSCFFYTWTLRLIWRLPLFSYVPNLPPDRSWVNRSVSLKLKVGQGQTDGLQHPLVTSIVAASLLPIKYAEFMSLFPKAVSVWHFILKGWFL